MEPIAQKEKIQTKLLQWFKKNGRDLPWRKTRDPYAIWVSEIMLQQTQVATVIPYYQKFLKSFPTLRHLARSDLTGVLKVWEGMGYYSRARNLHRASQIVLTRFHGKIPETLKDLLGLPGIGRSTAGSILSFAFHKDAPILDGNVKRVLSRLFAVSNTDAPNSLSLRGAKRRSNPCKNEIAAPFGLAMTCKGDKLLCIGKPLRGKTEGLLWQISESLIPKGFSNPFNQALMDLGSMLCTPKDPQCPRCPLHRFCKGRASGEPERFPTKRLKRSVPHVESVSAVIKKDGKFFLKQRPLKGLLGGLWEFPNWRIEGKQRSRLRSRLRNTIKKEMEMNVEVKEFIGVFHQTYSHFKLTLHVFYCQHLNGKGKGKWVPIRNLPLLPMSKIHRRIAQVIDEEMG
jgi:A/G-specific adenine glycosylase